MFATLVGFSAILLWAALALLTTASAGIPPFQLLTITFSIAALAGVVLLLRKGLAGLSSLRQPWPVWALGVGGLYGYHAFYFIALSHAPAVEVSLIAYLWPLLIVLMSGKPNRYALLGAVCGLIGASLLLIKDGGLTLNPQHWLGYLAALACAFTWSSYSVLNRRYAHVPTEIVTGFCAIVALLGAVTHGLFEDWVTPTMEQRAAMVALGLGPVGLAFFTWDYGTKHGNLPLLGSLSYSAPLLSTLLLIGFGRAQPSTQLALACLLIVGGAVLAGLLGNTKR